MTAKVASHRTFNEAGAPQSVKQRYVADAAKLLQRLKGALKRPAPVRHAAQHAGVKAAPVRHPSWLAARQARAQLRQQPTGCKLHFQEAGAAVQRPVGVGGLEGRWSRRRGSRASKATASPAAPTVSARATRTASVADAFFADEAAQLESVEAGKHHKGEGPCRTKQHAKAHCSTGPVTMPATSCRGASKQGPGTRRRLGSHNSVNAKPQGGAVRKKHQHASAHSYGARPHGERRQSKGAAKAPSGKHSTKHAAAPVHPSWQAAQQRRQVERQQTAKALHAAAGKRTVFDD